MPNLTKRQREVLEMLAEHDASPIGTTRLVDGRGADAVEALDALEKRGLIALAFKPWRITPAGRKALEEGR